MSTRRRPNVNANDMQRRKEMRRKFRTIVRMVMFNKIWLAGEEEQKMSLNVKRNIAMLVRTQQKIGTLTIAEKTIIRTLHGFRSIEDRKKLVTLLAGLTCFQTLPPKVRARLVPYVKHMLVTTGRTIIREGCEPHMIFFILSGEVEVTKKVYDHVKQEWVEKIQFIQGPGDYVGDIALLENTYRKRNYMARGDVELLVLYDEDDFDLVLRPVMAKMWEDKKKAIRCLDYFNYFSDEQIIIACKLGQLKQFDSLETIYHEDKGAVTYVHFIISGECMILQCLKMKTKVKNKGRKSFELVEVTKEDVEAMFKNKTKQELLEMMLKETHSENLLVGKKTLSTNTRKGLLKSVVSGDHMLRSIEIKCGLKRKSAHKGRNTGEHQASLNYEDISEESEGLEEEGEEGEEEFNEAEELEENEDEYDEYGTPEEALKKKKKLKHKKHETKYSVSESKTEGKGILKKRRTKTLEESWEENEENEEGDNVSFVSVTSSSSTKSTSSTSELEAESFRSEDTDVKIENHFIDVGSLTFGGIFGLGEKLEHRVIMARTTVQCLMLPRFWLFEKDQNPGNMWQRRRFYLDCTIPSRQSLFKNYITTRKWQAFKTKFIQSNLEHISGNPTKIQDVPIICRIVEANDD